LNATAGHQPRLNQNRLLSGNGTLRILPKTRKIKIRTPPEVSAIENTFLAPRTNMVSGRKSADVT
jgi:hypothetical protein